MNCPHRWEQATVEQEGRTLQVRRCENCGRWDEQRGGAWRVLEWPQQVAA